MPVWAGASALYFLYIAAVALVRATGATRSRMRAGIVATAGLLLSLLTAWVANFWVRDFFLPSILLLVGYWASGLLWIGPMPRIEAALGAIDRVLRVPQLARRLPGPICELLEVAYFSVYGLIPLAFFVHLAWSPAPNAERFWTVILVSDYVCFAMLPWIQTRPPRALERDFSWRSAFRGLNERLLGQVSIGANTVPSGHAAEGLALALLLADAPAPIAAWMGVHGLAISAGAVLGRYHFLLDAIAGWIVALLVWALV
jgi:hypothetical protein